MIDDGGPPHEAASCDGDHRCCRCVWMKYHARSRLDGNTLARGFTCSVSSTVGGYWMRRCTWSTLPLHCMRAAEGAAHCREDVSQSIQIRSDRVLSLPRSPHAAPGCDVGPDVRCVRAVFSDALHALQDAHTAGEKVSDTEVQRRVSSSPRLPRRGSGWAGSPRSCCAGIERRSACRCATVGIPAVYGREDVNVGHFTSACRRSDPWPSTTGLSSAVRTVPGYSTGASGSSRPPGHGRSSSHPKRPC
jgi:hypothetical protein